jgi:hypothetical protein
VQITKKQVGKEKVDLLYFISRPPPTPPSFICTHYYSLPGRFYVRTYKISFQSFLFSKKNWIFDDSISWVVFFATVIIRRDVTMHR